jgi:hypothetical protein
VSEKKFYLYIEGLAVQVSEEVYREYKHAEDKERYFMKRLKRGRFVVDEKNQTVTYVPGRETSYEQLLETEWAFTAPGEPLDDIMVKAQLMETLEAALKTLTDEELDLIRKIFYLEKSEREVSATFHLT